MHAQEDPRARSLAWSAETAELCFVQTPLIAVGPFDRMRLLQYKTRRQCGDHSEPGSTQPDSFPSGKATVPNSA